jgi:phosphopantothenoylcysteine decarboxylase/phosphopantothenate--cysteine ligase
LLGPAHGDQACGETGMGRMLEPERIYDEVLAHLPPVLLAGKRVLITAGPTFEAIDAVRGITNRSSGKMGYAVARAALAAGAQVTLISGPTALAVPAAARVESVTSADEMFAAVKNHIANTDIFISVAAVADYRPEQSAGGKIKKSDGVPNLKLVPTPDIVAWVAAQPNPPFCVGFAAETEKLHERAQEKRRRKKLPLLAANLVQTAIGADDNELVLFDDRGAHLLARAPKSMIARQLIAHIAKLLAQAAPQHIASLARGEQRLH